MQEIEIDESQLRRVRDGEAFCTLPNGIQIIRRKKHEPIPIDNLNKKELEGLTNKHNGAKYLPGTSLKRIVEMTVEVLLENNARIGTDTHYNKVMKEPIGISKGRKVRGLRVRCSNKGRYAHAYPEEEKLL